MFNAHETRKYSVKQAISVFLKYAKIFFILLIAAVTLLTAVFLIPDSMVAEHRELSRQVILSPDGEGAIPRGYFSDEAAAIDNLTDEIMLLLTTNTEHNAFKAALYCCSYARYWQGYLVFLRPALVLMNYRQIRYVNMFVFYALVCLVFSLMHKRFGLRSALAFIGALTGIYIFVIPVCLQFFSVFAILLVFSTVILTRYEHIGREKMRVLFFIAGCVTSFLDFLTAPLLTLGIPLILYICCEMDAHPERSGREHLKNIIVCSIVWGLGYGLFWAAKWVLGTVFLDINVIQDAGAQAALRMFGDAEHPYKLLSALRRNTDRMFLSQGMTLALPALALLLGLTAIAAAFRKKDGACAKQAPMLLIALYPYVWYTVLQNHSYILHMYTYRSQMITVLAVLLFLIRITDWKRFENAMTRVFCKRKPNNGDIQ